MLPNGSIQTTEIWKRFRADQRRTYLQDEIGRIVERVKGQQGRVGGGH